MPIKIICAWCGKDLGTKEGETESPVSHSICEECVQAEMEKIREIDRQKTSQEVTA